MAMVPAAKGKAIAGELEEEEAAACDVLDLSNAVKQLESEMTQIKLLIGAARTRKINNEQLVQFLQELKHLQYDGEDVLDELNYYRLKQQIEGGYSSLSLCTLSSDLRSSDELMQANKDDVLCVPRDKRQGTAYTIKEIVRRSRDITVPVHRALKLDKLDSVAMSNQGQSEISSSRLTGSYVAEPKVYGRDKEREWIIELMTSDILGGLTVLPMVGNGGVGKTTLAQVVYNDARVESHFVLKMWVCVSDNFDLVRLTHEMLDYVTEEEHTNIRNFNKLQQMLKKYTQSKRFLLILDDVWDISGKWDNLLAPLKHNQEVGSFVLVTTRDLSLAQVIGTVDQFDLHALEENDFWLLFKSYAFGDDKYKGHPRLQAIGREIARKLKGYPLGAKTIGALLRKSVTVEHWSRILRDEEWISLQNSDGIFPALKLSYDHLPCHLQECFSYCSLFPKDYRFHEAELVQMWISQDFVYNKNTSKRLEEIGAEHLADLVNFGFFQQMNDLDMVSGYYVMHDLMHDLACLVSAHECVTLDGSGPNKILPGIHHLSIICYPYRSDYPLLVEKIEKQLYKVRSVRKLRTLLLIGVCKCCFLRFFQNIFGEAQRLRLLLLKENFVCSDRACAYLDYSIFDILNPCHLRYLNLVTVRKMGAKRQDVSKFYNLQVLGGVYEVDSEKLCNLVNLRHLVGIQWVHSSIAYVGKMTSLQELQNFNVRNTDGFDIGQVKWMNELVLLRVSHLENIKSGTEACRARLTDKSHLNELSLSWDDSGVSSGFSAQAAASVLEALEPHQNLKHLRITGYMGVTSPSWLAANLSVTCLQTIHLENCREWLIPPSLGEMQTLKKLTLVRMHAFKEVLIPYLEELVLIEMSKLETCIGPDEHQLPSCLRTLRIEKCSKLATCLPLQSSSYEGNEMECFPSLCELTIRDCPHVTVSYPLATVSNIPYVNIKGSSKHSETYKNVGGFGLPSDELRMLDDKILPLGNRRCRSIPIRECPNLMSLSLSEMTIEDCPNFLSPHVTSDANANHEGNSATMCFVLPSLKRLKIGRCGIAGKWISQMLSHAQSMFMLHLTDCPNVKLLLINCPLEEAGGSNLALSSGCSASAATALDECVLQVPTDVCSSLVELHISNCPDLILGGGKGGFAAFNSLKFLEIRGCPSLLSSMFRGNGNPLPLSLYKVDIDHLPAEVLLGENMSSLKKLSIWNCPRLRSLQLHPSCNALEFLEIRNCEQLAVLEGLQFLDSLELLDISISRELAVTWCHKLREQEEGSGQTSPLLPPSLQNLSIWDLTDKLQSHLLFFLPSLSRLWVYNSPNLMSLQLGSCTALECLTVANCGSLSSLEGLQHIRGFTELTVSDCPVLMPHLELVFRQPWSHGLYSQLRYLTIDDPSILTVPICKRLTSLSWLTLGSYYFIGSKHIKRMVSLTKEHERALQCLTSLRLLQIENCPNLLHLPADLYSLPCLAHLEITNCPGISKLPENGLPPSLVDLWVNGCSEELNEQCRMAAKEVVRVKIDGESVN